MAVSTHLRQILALLRSGDPEEAVAAAVVLGALAPKDKAATDALGKALAAGHPPLALAAVRALGRIGNKAALDALLPLLDEPGPLRETAAYAVAACGKAAFPAVKKALGSADPATRRTLFTVLAGMRTAEAQQLVLAGFQDESFETVKAAGRALRAAIGGMTDAERNAATRTALAFLKSKPVRESRGVTNSTLIYLGYLARPAAVKALLPYTGPDHAPSTRRHALQALRASFQGEAVDAATVKTLFPYLDDPEREAVVEPTLAVLETAALGAAEEKELRRLTGARHVVVRQFAVRKLAEGTTAKSAETLVELLDHEDERLRRSAVHAVQRSPKAPRLLLPRVLKEKDPEKAWAFVHLVKPHASELAPADRKKVLAAAVRYLDKGDERAKPLLHLARAADEDGFFKEFHRRALAAKKARKLAQAERDLRLLVRHPAFDTETRFQLAVITLKGALGKDLVPRSEGVEAIRVLERMAADPRTELPRRLRKESRFLGPEGAYALGFRLVEGSGPGKVLGADLLRDLARKGARTRTGKMARAKLATEGIG